MKGRAAPRDEHVTDTGWRVVGDAIPLVTRNMNSGELSAGRPEDVLWAASFRLRARMGKTDLVHITLAALGAAVSRGWPEAPPLTHDRPLLRPAGRFQGLQWNPVGERDAWTGELVWRHPHPVIAGAPCTTHVLVAEQHGHTTLTVRVTADAGISTVRGTVGAGQVRPTFLAEINRSARLLFDGGDGDPRVLTDPEVNAFVRDVLLSEARTMPIAVLSPLEDGSYVLPASEIADELLGVAHVHVIDRHPTTFRLTDALRDRRLSCYWGALRVYMPGFSCADRPEDHPLLMSERLLDPVIRADLVGKLSRAVAHRVELRSGARATADGVLPTQTAAAMVPVPASPPVAARDSTNVTRPHVDAAPGVAVADFAPLIAAMSPVLSGLGAQLGALSATVLQLIQANAALGDEIARLRTTTAVRAAGASALERRIGSMEALLQAHVEPAPPSRTEADPATTPSGEDAGERTEHDTDAVTLVDVLRQAATAYTDTLLILDAAERTAADSPYEDVDRFAAVIDAMAAIAHRRQEGALGTPLRAAFREFGIDYRGAISPGTSEKLRQQYLISDSTGIVYDCREHIVLGTSYDPRYCLRVYFTSRAPVESRFVIGYVGRHLDVASTT